MFAFWTKNRFPALLPSILALILSWAFPAFSQNQAQVSTKDGAPQTGQVSQDRALPFPLTNSFNRGVQTVTGITFVSQFIAGQVVQHVLKRKLGGQVKVKLRTWSLTDLLSGKIKSLDIRLKSSHYKDVALGRIKISSASPVWLRYRRENDNRPGLRTPLLLSLDAHLTQENVSEALTLGRVASSLRALKLDLPGLGEQQLQVLDPKVTMADNLITVHGLLVTAGASRDTGVDITVSGKPQLERDDRIILSDMTVACPDIIEPQKFAKFVEELLNPLVNLHRFDRPNFALRLDSLKVADGGIDATGRLLIAPKAAPHVADNNSQH
jgi:hypothetical protein